MIMMMMIQAVPVTAPRWSGGAAPGRVPVPGQWARRPGPFKSLLGA
jgi:hypothetical protein